jgi:hypothetical protein
VTSKPLIASALAIILGTAGLLAQQKKNLNEDPNIRSVSGLVMDPDNRPVKGAVVQLKDTKTLQIRSFITQDDGKYHFAGLSTNVDYELKAEHQGVFSGVKRLSLFSTNKASTVDLKLKPETTGR